MNRRNWFNSAFVGVCGLCGFKFKENQEWQWQWWYDEKEDLLYLELNSNEVNHVYHFSRFESNILSQLMKLKKQESLLRLEEYKLLYGDYPCWLIGKHDGFHKLLKEMWTIKKKKLVKFEV